jgi:two-component system, LuxR family, response regulator FixJ
MAEPRSVYIVDDEAAVRESVSVLLEPWELSVHGFASVEEFLSAIPSLAPGCVISDIRMPGMSGIELLEKLAPRGRRFPVVVMTGYGEVPLAVHALKAGAVDFIEKPFPGSVLIDAVLSALQSIDEAPTAMAEVGEFAQRIASLTAREREVMDSMIEGKQNKEIAYQLGISSRTVEVYRAHVMKKMQVRSLAALVRMAVVAGGEV